MRQEVKVTLSSGSVYFISMSANEFLRMMRNDMGILINGLKEVSEGLYINPSHVSSVEVIG